MSTKLSEHHFGRKLRTLLLVMGIGAFVTGCHYGYADDPYYYSGVDDGPYYTAPYAPYWGSTTYRHRYYPDRYRGYRRGYRRRDGRFDRDDRRSRRRADRDRRRERLVPRGGVREDLLRRYNNPRNTPRF